MCLISLFGCGFVSLCVCVCVCVCMYGGWMSEWLVGCVGWWVGVGGVGVGSSGGIIK